MFSTKMRLRRFGSAVLAACLCCAASGQSSSPGSGEGLAGGNGGTEHIATGNSAEDLPGTLKSLRREVNTGHASEALKEIADLRAKHGEAPGLSRVEGLADYALGNVKAAEEAFAVALQNDPSDQESLQMRGLALYGLGRSADAIPLLEAAGRVVAKGDASIGKADPNYLLALCYMDTQRYDDARHAMAAQYRFPADSPEAYLLAARMLFRREYLPAAQSFAEKAIALEPNLPLAHELLGEIALAGNRLDEAIADLEKERAHNPLEGLIYDRLGDAYDRAARYDDAQRSLEEAVLLEPNSTGPYILLGKTLLKKNDPLGAATYLEHAKQMDPSNYITHTLLVQAYRAMGRREDATREAETSRKLLAAREPKFEKVP